MNNRKLSLTWSLLLLGFALVFSGCESTQTASNQTDQQTAAAMAATTSPSVAEDDPEPSIWLDGFEVVDNYSEDVDMEMSSMSAQTYGPDDMPFTFEKTTMSDQRSVTSGRIKVFPANNDTANLLFYREVGLPMLKVEQLDDGYVRIWLRVRNLVDQDIFINVTCEGQDINGRTRERYHYDTVIFQEDVFRDFTFVLRGDPSKRFSIIVVESQKNKRLAKTGD